MKVLFAALRWDYKDPARGDSFEYWNFWDVLSHMEGIEAELFPFDEMESRLGRDEMNKALLRKVEEDRPDLVFFFFFTNEFDPLIVERITRLTTTVNWFADDQWRFEGYSRHWAPHLSYVATTDRHAYEAYRRLGFRNAIRTQWGSNHRLYRPLDLERDLDITFVGQPHGDRRRTVDRLRSEGFRVDAWGHGWEAGRLTQDQMIDVFSRSKVNLNLSNASGPIGLRGWGSLFMQRRGRVFVPRTPSAIKVGLAEARAKQRDQIKGRNFEIPACRTMLVTTAVEGLEEYFEFGKEVVTFTDVDDLVRIVRHYLSAKDEREAIAQAGYERVLKDHTYEIRFTQLFREMELM